MHSGYAFTNINQGAPNGSTYPYLFQLGSTYGMHPFLTRNRQWYLFLQWSIWWLVRSVSINFILAFAPDSTVTQLIFFFFSLRECQHRWVPVVNMVQFYNQVGNAGLANVISGSNNQQLAYERCTSRSPFPRFDVPFFLLLTWNIIPRLGRTCRNQQCWFSLGSHAYNKYEWWWLLRRRQWVWEWDRMHGYYVCLFCPSYPSSHLLWC